MKDIQKFSKAYYENLISEWLADLRLNPAIYEVAIGLINTYARKGGLGDADLKRLGVTQAELDSLRVQGCKLRIQSFLTRLRSGAHQDVITLVTNIRCELGKGNLSPNEVGSTEDELNKALGVMPKQAYN